MARTSEPALHILVALLPGERHGYAIADDIEQLTGRRPGPGTLYGALSRLEAAGLIEAQPGDNRRRPYRLTPDGLDAVRDEIQRLTAFTGEATRRLRLNVAR